MAARDFRRSIARIQNERKPQDRQKPRGIDCDEANAAPFKNGWGKEFMSAGVIVRISRGHFAPENYGEVRRLIEASARTLVPALNRLTGLIYFHAAVDVATNTVVNISLWTDLEAAKQMDDLNWLGSGSIQSRTTMPYGG
jgi:hypothetical protein